MSRSGAFLEPSGPVFKAAFVATALTSAGDKDMFVLTALSDSRVVVREIKLGQYSDAGDAEAEMLSVYLGLDSTSTGAGTAITPQNVARHTGAPSAGASVTGPSSTLVSTTSIAVLDADSFNVAAGWL